MPAPVTSVSIPMPPETPASNPMVARAPAPTTAPAATPATPTTQPAKPNPAPAPTPAQAKPADLPQPLPTYDAKQGKFVLPDGRQDQSVVDLNPPEATTKPTDDDVETPTTDAATDTTTDTPTDPAAAATVKPGGRDYTKYLPDHAAILRKLPNEQFNALAPVFEKAKADHEALTAAQARVSELETEAKAKPTHYYEHEDGYLLDPEFGTLLNNQSEAQQAREFWTQQLIAIEQGEPYKIPSNGKLVDVTPSDTAPINPAHKIALQQLLTRASFADQQVSAQIEQFKGSHKQQFTAARQQIAAIEKHFFPNFDVNKLAPEDRENYDAIYKITPKQYHDDRTRLYAQTYTSFMQLARYAQKITAELEQLKKTTTPVRPRALTDNPSVPTAEGDQIIPWNRKR